MISLKKSNFILDHFTETCRELCLSNTHEQRVSNSGTHNKTLSLGSSASATFNTLFIEQVAAQNHCLNANDTVEEVTVGIFCRPPSPVGPNTNNPLKAKRKQRQR